MAKTLKTVIAGVLLLAVSAGALFWILHMQELTVPAQTGHWQTLRKQDRPPEDMAEADKQFWSITLAERDAVVVLFEAYASRQRLFDADVAETLVESDEDIPHYYLATPDDVLAFAQFVRVALPTRPFNAAMAPSAPVANVYIGQTRIEVGQGDGLWLRIDGMGSTLDVRSGDTEAFYGFLNTLAAESGQAA